MKNLVFRSALVVLASVGLLCAADNGNDRDVKPNGKGNIPLGESSKARPQGSNGISYHNGPLLTTGVHMYYIWYGDWAGSDTQAAGILNNLANKIGGSPYFNINTTYYDGSNTHVLNSVTLSGSRTVSAYLGNSLSDGQIQQVVSDSINGGFLPKDTSGVYFVLTSQEVNASSGFCTQYCGWHTHGTIAGSDIKYSFVGNPARCPSACSNSTAPPNGDLGADAMASIIAHELEEATTDPDLNAWYDVRGAENADKCAWTFGTTYSNGTGIANVKLGTLDYLIQRNWVNAGGGYCSMSF